MKQLRPPLTSLRRRGADFVRRVGVSIFPPLADEVWSLLRSTPPYEVRFAYFSSGGCWRSMPA